MVDDVVGGLIWWVCVIGVVVGGVVGGAGGMMGGVIRFDWWYGGWCSEKSGRV